MYESSPKLTNATFAGNSANTSGGGMYNFSRSAPRLTACAITGNIAATGGGMHNNSLSAPQLSGCIISGNTATIAGGGMYNTAYPAPVVVNSILWEDTPDEVYNSNSIPEITYSDVQGGYAGDGNIDIDPRFVDPSSDDYHLMSNSPGIDAGSNAALFLPVYDFEGDERILDGNDDGIAIVDMGVDEVVVKFPNSLAEISDGIPGSLQNNIMLGLQGLPRGKFELCIGFRGCAL